VKRIYYFFSQSNYYFGLNIAFSSLNMRGVKCWKD